MPEFAALYVRRATRNLASSGLTARKPIIEVPEAERACPKCGDEREVIGHDISEVVELIPAQVMVIAPRPNAELVAAVRGRTRKRRR